MGHANELNYSDWIEWLFNYNKVILNNVFNQLLQEEFSFVSIKRESKNIDIIINSTVNGKKIFIENKVKNIQMPLQLDKYATKYGTIKGSYVMLSLTEPVFFNNGEYIVRDIKKNNRERKFVWKYVSYKEFFEVLDKVLEESNDSLYNNVFYKYIREDIYSLSKIIDRFKFNFEEDKFEEVLNTDFSNKLNEIKLRPLYEKFFSAKIMYEVYKKLEDKNLKVSITDQFKDAIEDEITCWQSFSFNEKCGIADFKYIYSKEGNKIIVLGFQVSGCQLRRVIEVENIKEQVRDILAEKWFEQNKENRKIIKYNKGKFTAEITDISRWTINRVITKIVDEIQACKNI